MRIAVTAGYTKSLHSIALIESLAAAGHDVSLVLLVRMFNLQRIRSYSRRLGFRGLLRRINSRLLRGSGPTTNVSREVGPMLEFVRTHGVTSRSVAQACNKTGAKLVNVKGLTAPEAIDALRSDPPDLIVYSGGGILRKPFIDTAKIGVLNAHGGPLPPFRGMNAAEWSLYYGVHPCVTFHFIDTGVDTGPMLFAEQIPLGDNPTVEEIRGQATAAGVQGLLKAVEMVNRGDLKPTPQCGEDGRQFFVMAEPLLEVLQHWFDTNQTPIQDHTVPFSFGGRDVHKFK